MTETIANPPTQKRGRGRPSLKKPVMARDALLRSALAVFSQKGFEAASVRQIATTCSVDPALIKHHFGSKLELWQAVVRYLAEQYQSRRNLALATLPAMIEEKYQLQDGETLGPREALEMFIGNFVQFSAEVPELGMFISNEATEQGERIEYIVTQLIEPFYGDFMPVVKVGIEQGILAAQNPKLFFFMLMHAVAMPLAFPRLLNQFSGAKVGSPTFIRQLKENVVATFILPR